MIGYITANGILRCVGNYNSGSTMTLYGAAFTVSGNVWTCVSCGYQAMPSGSMTVSNVGQVIGIL